MINEPEEWTDLRQEMAVWRNRFLRLLDRSPAPTAISQSDGLLVITNPAFSALWGLTPGHMRDLNLLDLLVSPDEESLHKLSEGLRFGRRFRYPIRVEWDAEGMTRTGQLTVEPVSDEVITPTLLMAFLHVDPMAHGAEPNLAQDLSPKETRILALVASGATSALIARSVGLTADGVNYHLSRMCRLLKVPNRTALVAKAYVLGLLNPTSWPPDSEEGQ
ncbi:LuxR C-terminal-related transcriptional regulator [Streptomyces sp. NPDC004546]|uniref:helix-turn-helix transcriptional regulator n=1 Tax=Streptomyces sp. NPDC004546 TaxID=3154282 RepID=UPI0033A022C4